MKVIRYAIPVPDCIGNGHDFLSNRGVITPFYIIIKTFMSFPFSAYLDRSGEPMGIKIFI